MVKGQVSVHSAGYLCLFISDTWLSLPSSHHHLLHVPPPLDNLLAGKEVRPPVDELCMTTLVDSRFILRIL